MKFYVTDTDYKPLSIGFDSLETAAEYACDLVLDYVITLRSIDEAIVLGMKSDTYRTDIPAPLFLKVKSLAEKQADDA